MNIIIQLSEQFGVSLETMITIVEEDLKKIDELKTAKRIMQLEERIKKLEDGEKEKPDWICRECLNDYYECGYTKKNCPYRKGMEGKRE